MITQKTWYSFGITLLLIGSLGIAGWIGFQEHWRLLAESLKQELAREAAPSSAALSEISANPKEITTADQAESLFQALETQLETLETNDLPDE